MYDDMHHGTGSVARISIKLHIFRDFTIYFVTHLKAKQFTLSS